MVGLVVGLIRFGLEFGFQKPACGSGGQPPPDWWYSVVDKVHYLHFGELDALMLKIIYITQNDPKIKTASHQE